MSEKLFKIKVVTPNGLSIDSNIKFLKVRTKTGDVGILANHANYVTVLDTGKMILEYNDETIEYFVAGGFLEVKDGNVTIIADDLLKYDEKDKIFEERKAQIEKAIIEKLKEDQNVLGTKKKIQDSLNK